MAVILLCTLDASAALAQQALLDRVSHAVLKGQAELIFIGDPAVAASGSHHSVFAIRFWQIRDAETFIQAAKTELGPEGDKATPHMTLLHPREPTLKDLATLLMFP